MKDSNAMQLILLQGVAAWKGESLECVSMATANLIP